MPSIWSSKYYNSGIHRFQFHVICGNDWIKCILVFGVNMIQWTITVKQSKHHSNLCNTFLQSQQVNWFGYQHVYMCICYSVLERRSSFHQNMNPSEVFHCSAHTHIHSIKSGNLVMSLSARPSQNGVNVIFSWCLNCV